LKVILTRDVPKLGKSGELKQVADGYATNYLIPQSLAVPAAGGAYRAWQHDIASREDKRKREREEAEIAATRIASTTLTMGVKVGDGGKLYGSITSKDIADALARFKRPQSRGLDSRTVRHRISERHAELNDISPGLWQFLGNRKRRRIVGVARHGKCHQRCAGFLFQRGEAALDAGGHRFFLSR